MSNEGHSVCPRVLGVGKKESGANSWVTLPAPLNFPLYTWVTDNGSFPSPHAWLSYPTPQFSSIYLKFADFCGAHSAQRGAQVTTPSTLEWHHLSRRSRGTPGFLPGESQGWRSLVGPAARNARHRNLQTSNKWS